MPDVILCWQDGIFGSLAYQDVGVLNSTTRFIEEEALAGDATVVDRTWRYVNKMKEINAAYELLNSPW